MVQTDLIASTIKTSQRSITSRRFLPNSLRTTWCCWTSNRQHNIINWPLSTQKTDILVQAYKRKSS